MCGCGCACMNCGSGRGKCLLCTMCVHRCSTILAMSLHWYLDVTEVYILPTAMGPSVLAMQHSQQ